MRTWHESPPDGWPAKDSGADRLELVPVGDDLFEVRANQARYQFQRERGRIVALEMQPLI
jgi:hypothetical protein